ncbi:MAG: penicillin-binding protein 2 [Desulfurobacteriaceae bacterium]
MRLLRVFWNAIVRFYRFVSPFKDDRLNLFLFISLFLVVIYFGKLLSLTYFNKDFWISFVKEQSKGVIRISSERGKILDRNGIPLATSERIFSFYIRPTEIKDKELFKRIILRDKDVLREYLKRKDKLTNENLELLLQILSVFSEISDKDIEKAYKKKYTIVKLKGKTIKVPFVWLKKELSVKREKVLKAVLVALRVYYTLSNENRFKKKYPDILGFVSEFRRVYPYAVGSVIVGITNKVGEGLSGLEHLLEKRKIITGDEVVLSGLKDATGKVYLGKDASVFLTRKKGNNVITTIDGNLQYIFEKTIKKYGDKWHPNFINAVLMDPYTGEILAAASYPFKPLVARFVTTPYEPGSVMKPIVLAAAINEGVITENTIIDCPAYYKVGKKVFHNEFRGKDVKLRAWEVIKFSDNIGIIKIVQKLGKEKYYKYLKAFGFGRKTGISLPAESPGILRRWEKWKDVEFATLSFGHFISVTTLQLAVAYSVLVNGGYYVRPRILSAIVDDKGNVLKRFPSIKERKVISEKTSKIMRRVLTMVVESGTGIGTKLENFFIGGKTGTAQKYDPKFRDYNPEKATLSFVGAFPMTNPRFVLAVTVDDPKLPKEKLWASKVAVPIFRELAERVLLYERVAPDKKEYLLKENGEIISIEINQDFLLKNGLQDDVSTYH